MNTFLESIIKKSENYQNLMKFLITHHEKIILNLLPNKEY